MNKELLKKNPADLEKEIAEKRVALRDLRFGSAGSANKNVKQAANLKREIARLKTVLNQKLNNE